MAASTHSLTLPGGMLRRGFWLYVWRVETAGGELLYVGRTGDNSSPNATAPYTRMGQHLGDSPSQNALRKHLETRGLKPEECAFHLVAHGPLFPEVAKSVDRASAMSEHIPVRNIVGALEMELAKALKAVGYDVLNTVKWKHAVDEGQWTSVRAAFAEHFPKLDA